MRNLISMRDLSAEDILKILKIASDIEDQVTDFNMTNKIAALLFFEPSTRTQFSFDTAMKKLGGQTIIMNGTQNTSAKKGESLADTLLTISQYADIIIMRSPIEGAARYASEIVSLPVVNAGDGANQHPTQALLDLYSIQKTQGNLMNLNIGIAGDLKFGRTVHSLVQAMSLFDAKFKFFSPKFLSMPQHIKDYLNQKEAKFEELDENLQGIDDLDILYITRIQKERFASPEDYEKVRGSYCLTETMLVNVRPSLKILHPLPRVDELSPNVDNTPYAYYFQQAKNGVYVRQAIISTLLWGGL